MEKNPPPRKSHATRLTQRQTQKRDKFQLFEPLLFFIDPDFENFVGLPRMLNRVYRAANISAIVEPRATRAFSLAAGNHLADRVQSFGSIPNRNIASLSFRKCSGERPAFTSARQMFCSVLSGYGCRSCALKYTSKRSAVAAGYVAASCLESMRLRNPMCSKRGVGCSAATSLTASGKVNCRCLRPSNPCALLRQH